VWDVPHTELFVRNKSIIMKKTILVFFLTLNLYAQAQLNFEGQLGGSNFLGITARTETLMNLDKTATHSLGLTLGVGASIHQSSLIIQSGLHYYFRNWGIGSEISGFSKNPFNANSLEPDLAFITYPNVNYSFRFKKDSYLKVSFGVLLSYDRSYKNDYNHTIQFAGNPIPGIGISHGIHYPKK
jgi:hypothetical protein